MQLHFNCCDIFNAAKITAYNPALLPRWFFMTCEIKCQLSYFAILDRKALESVE